MVAMVSRCRAKATPILRNLVCRILLWKDNCRRLVARRCKSIGLTGARSQCGTDILCSISWYGPHAEPSRWTTRFSNLQSTQNLQRSLVNRTGSGPHWKGRNHALVLFCRFEFTSHLYAPSRYQRGCYLLFCCIHAAS